MTWDVFAELQEIDPAVREAERLAAMAGTRWSKRNVQAARRRSSSRIPPLKEGEEPGLSGHESEIGAAGVSVR